MTPTQAKKPSARKSLCLFTKISRHKKTAIRQVGYVKSKRKVLKPVTTLWAKKAEQNGN